MTIAERNVLIESLLHIVEPAVAAIHRTLAPGAFDRDDLEQTGRVALIEAVERWDERKGSLEQWARWRVKYRVLDSIRRRNWKYSTHSDIADVPESLFSYQQDLDEQVSHSRLRDLMAELTPRESRVLQLLFWHGCTLGEAAAQLDLAPWWVAWIRNGALAKLAAELGVEGEAAEDLDGYITRPAAA